MLNATLENPSPLLPSPHKSESIGTVLAFGFLDLWLSFFAVLCSANAPVMSVNRQARHFLGPFVRHVPARPLAA
jgi:hypothetical protein